MRIADRLSGRKLFVSDPAGNPARRRVIALSTDGGIFAGPPTAAADPTVTGATLTLVDTAGATTQAIPLPATNWTVRPKAGGTVFVYRDGD